MYANTLDHQTAIEGGVLFHISGHKVKSMLVRHDGILTMNKSAEDVAGFENQYEKYRLLYSGRKLTWPKIKKIVQIENIEGIKLHHKGYLFPINEEFTFDNPYDIPRFYDLLENQYFFKKSRKQLTPMQSVRGMWLPLSLVILITAFSYWQAIEIEMPDHSRPDNAKELAFETFIGFLGKGGVLGLGAGILSVLMFRFRKIYTGKRTEILMENTLFGG
jgi:hypothetical protein